MSFEITCNIRFTALLNALHFSARDTFLFVSTGIALQFFFSK